MTTRSRVLLAAAALLLLGLYVTPIWRITLEAPQYPEGIGMQIMLDDVRGLNPHDLTNINGLNHYIGMREIVPESIPELKIMPWFFAALIAFGLVAAGTGRRALLYTWAGVFVLAMVVGLIDFWWWGYDYGHNLNPDAAIKVPGMAYQPPLIGSKQLLNFTSHSYPDVGGVLAFVSMALGGLAAFFEWRRPTAAASATSTTGVSASSKAATSKIATVAVAALALGLLLSGCTPEPRPIRYGEDQCAQCVMSVADPRYGAELVLATGKVLTFDSIECLTAYVLEYPDVDVHSRWVTDFEQPERLVRVDDVFFLHSERLRSPMGANLTAFGSGTTPDAALNAFGGAVLDWDGVLATVGERSAGGNASHAR